MENIGNIQTDATLYLTEFVYKEAEAKLEGQRLTLNLSAPAKGKVSAFSRDWTLSIDSCAWRIDTPGTITSTSLDPRPIDHLVWGTVEELTLNPPGMDLEIYFSNQVRLTVFITETNPLALQWTATSPLSGELIVHGGGQWKIQRGQKAKSRPSGETIH